MYDDFEYNQWIVQFKSIEKINEALSFVLTLLYSLDGSKQVLFEAEIKKFENIFTNLNFMRRVKHRDSLVQDYPSEYFGKDYGADDPFMYQADVEEVISNLNLELMSVLGRIIKVSKESELILGDET